MWSSTRAGHGCLARLIRQQSLRRAYATAAASKPATVISPTLLIKARNNAQEHERLASKISDGFDTTVAKRIGELAPIAEAYQNLEKATSSLEELKALIDDPKGDRELKEMAAEDMPTAQEEIVQAANTLTGALAPRHPFAELPCLLEIQPGVGGAEAALFAGDLLRMYQGYCSSHGLRVTMLKYEDSDGISDPNGSDAPLKEAILEIEGKGAYGMLRGEAGVHRVQRVPATESKGRVHTSVAAVLVLPSFPDNPNDIEGTDIDFDDPNSDYYVNPQDVRVDTMRARGAGGQHVNTTDSAVRLTHEPTNTVVACQDERSQLKNRAKAWKLLRSRLAQQKREAREEEMLKMRRNVTGIGKMGRADKVRTYNFNQQRVTDHRSGMTVQRLDEVMEGGTALEEIMQSVRTWLQDREIEALIDEDGPVHAKPGK